jgi:dTDP-glucose pyrophosphorylase
MMPKTDTLPEHLRPLVVSADLPVIEAIQKLNDAHKRIILAVDDDGRLEGVVTDSNIRHAILNRVDFQRPIREIMADKPVTALPDTPNETILTLMQETTAYQIPIVDADRRLRDIVFLDELLRGRPQQSSRLAVVMAGGLGKRLKPLTDDTPKPLLQVGGKPILFVVMDGLISQGFDRIVVTLNFKADMIREAVAAEERFCGIVEFLEEKKALGTAGALSLLPQRPDSSFLVLNGDLLTKVAADEMLRFHALEKNAITVAVKEENFVVPYGVARLEGTRIVRMDEKPEYSYFLNAGVYVVNPSVLDHVPQDQFVDMPDIVDDALARNMRVGCFPVHEYWLDIGMHSQLERANADYKNYFSDDRDG